MKLLAIETATEACSAAIDINNECIHRFEVAPRRHTELILPMIDELLSEAGIQVKELDAIAFGQGPGAFTGVRIAMGVIQGLAFAHDTPVIPVSTLAALAQHYADTYNCVASAIDARMQEIYWGMYKKNNEGLMESVVDEKVCVPTNISNPEIECNSWFGVGTGWQTYASELKMSFTGNLDGIAGEALPSAADVMVLAKPAYLEGKYVSVEEVAPVYLRNKVASK